MKIRPLASVAGTALGIAALVGCSAEPAAPAYVHDAASDSTYSIGFAVVGPEAESIADDTVTVQGDDAVAMDLMQWYFAENDIAFEQENGMVQVISDLASDGSDGWLMWVDGELAEVGADSLELQDGLAIEWRYVNYDEVFAQ